MTQKRFHSFEASLDSFSESLRFLGVLEPGVYRGFDRATFSGTAMTLLHDGTGVSQTNIATDSVDENVAVLITKQGMVIQEDASIGPLTVDNNVGNSQARTDYVIMEHAYAQTEGGATAVYSIIKGPVESATEPSLTNENTQVLIGKLVIPAGAADHTTTSFIRSRNKGLADTFFLPLKGASDLFSHTSITSFNDLNYLTSNGIYKTDANPTNKPPTGSTGQYIVLVLSDSVGAFTYQLVMDAQLGKAYCRVRGASTWTSFVSLNNSDITGDITQLASDLAALTTRVTDLETYKDGDLATTLSGIATDINNINTTLTNLQSSVTANSASITALETLTTDHTSQLDALHNNLATRVYSNITSGAKDWNNFVTTPNGSDYQYEFPSPQIPTSDFNTDNYGKSKTRLFGFVEMRVRQEGASGDGIIFTVQGKPTGSSTWTNLSKVQTDVNDFGFPMQAWFDYEYFGVPGSPFEFRIVLEHTANEAMIHTNGNSMHLFVMVN